MVADAVNNLSDAATSVVTLIGFRLAGQEADEDHPFGHGRVEYIAGLIVAMAILLMGVEVGRSALESLFGQSETQFSPVALVILAAAILVKFWMYWFNRGLGRAIDSAAMEATAADSLSDCLSTGVVLLSTLADHFWGLQVDGLAGLLVAAFILKTGWEAARDTLDPLLGRPMDPGARRGHRPHRAGPRPHSGHPRPGLPRLWPRSSHDVLPRRGPSGPEIFWSSMTLSTISSGN